MVNSVNTVTADNATVSITINVTVYEASYTNTLVLKNGSTTILTISGLSWSKGTANRTVTLTSAQRTTLLNAMASIKSFTGAFAVSSYSGSTQIGSTSSKTATVLTTATNSAPTISGFTYADSYTTTKNLTGNDQLFVQDYSTLKVTPELRLRRTERPFPTIPLPATVYPHPIRPVLQLRSERSPSPAV